MIQDVVNELKDRWPAADCVIKNKNAGVDAGYRVLFIVRTDGRDMLVYDTLGRAYKVECRHVNVKKFLPPFIVEEQGGYLVAIKPDTGHMYKIGPVRFDPDFKLGCIYSYNERCKAGSGRKDADELIDNNPMLDVMGDSYF